MRMFLAWLNQREGWADVGPQELLIRQLKAENPYEIPELLQEYVTCHPNLRRATLYDRVWAILGYLRKNHSRLPTDVKWNWFKVKSNLHPVQGRLTAEMIANVASRLPVRWRSLFLVKYQALLDTRRLYWVNCNSADQIASQLRDGKDIVRVDIPCGRKKRAGEFLGVYFTFFGRDAATELTRYFDEERGWPKWGEPIWVYTQEDADKNNWLRCKNRKIGDAIECETMESKWIRSLRSAKYIPKKPNSIVGPSVRYGYNLHEFRDVAMTELHMHAKSEGLSMDSVKFWCGHLGALRHSSVLSDKLYKNRDYMEQQYAIAEPHLNLISRTPATRTGAREGSLSCWSYGTSWTSCTSTLQLE
jgi:hypothetical protein